MNRNEISTLLKFVSKTRILFNKTVSNQTIDADWRIFSYVISNHLENKLCTTTSIIQVSGLPFATGLRKTIRWFEENWEAIQNDAEFPPGMSSAVKNYVLKQEK